ncbi:MAG: hypothetical protein HYR67_17675 [Bacteroidetes bacterium]|nr:hypothetical protein [Bacteroidota bacterium]
MKSVLLVLMLISTYSLVRQKEFSWLVGTWQEEGKQSFEVWKWDDNFLSAESYKMKEGSKIITEEIKLIKKGNEFYYVTDVAGPQGPVEFKITSFGLGLFTAENPAHDFPKKISYEKIDDTHLKATIGDANKTIGYTFIKIK